MFWTNPRTNTSTKQQLYDHLAPILQIIMDKQQMQGTAGEVRMNS